MYSFNNIAVIYYKAAMKMLLLHYIIMSFIITIVLRICDYSIAPKNKHELDEFDGKILLHVGDDCKFHVSILDRNLMERLKFFVT